MIVMGVASSKTTTVLDIEQDSWVFIRSNSESSSVSSDSNYYDCQAELHEELEEHVVSKDVELVPKQGDDSYNTEMENIEFVLCGYELIEVPPDYEDTISRSR